MFPTSDPGGSPSGITAARPTSPRAASASSTGVAAAWSGVRPSSWSTGSSAHPSGTHTTYFTRRYLAVLDDRPHGVLAVDVLDSLGEVHDVDHALDGRGRGPEGRLHRLGELQRVGGGQHDHGDRR